MGFEPFLLTGYRAYPGIWLNYPVEQLELHKRPGGSFELAARPTWTILPCLLMKYDLLEGSTHLIPGFKHQLRLELVEQLELELPCLIMTRRINGNKVRKLVKKTFFFIFFWEKPKVTFLVCGYHKRSRNLEDTKVVTYIMLLMYVLSHCPNY